MATVSAAMDGSEWGPLWDFRTSLSK